MKRFYKEVAIGGDRAILLDGRAVRTPARAPLIAPTDALATAIAAEWADQRDEIDPQAMPMTGLLNAAIDHVLPAPAAFAAPLAAYAETDVLLYRAESPPELAAREVMLWDPILAWARTRYDVHFEPVTGILHRPQPARTIVRLGDALTARDPYALAAMMPLVTIGGSLIAALGLAEGALDPDAAFAATHADELWQMAQWGEDPLAERARAARRRDYLNAARFLTLLDSWAGRDRGATSNPAPPNAAQQPLR